jgi:hypothetical protein
MLAGLFLHSQRGQERLGGDSVESGAVVGVGERPVRVQKGAVYQSTIGAEPNYRIAADSVSEFDNGWAELSNVQLSLYSKGEVAYGLVASRARFNKVLNEARTEGESTLSLQGGIALSAPGFSVKGVDRVLESQGAVSFAGPGWGGVADRAVAHLADNSLELVGNVTMGRRRPGGDMAGALTVLAPRLVYRRRQATV